MKTDKKSESGIDLITPIIDIIHELLSLLLKLSWELGKKSAFKVLKGEKELKSIERKLLFKKKAANGKDELGYSSSEKRPMKLNEIDFGKHSFIVGAAGFGKTNLISILQENSLNQNKPIIFFDPKGDSEALETFKVLCKLKGKNFYIFSEHHEESIQLNPLKEGTTSQIVERVMSAFEWSEQFYKDQAERELRKTVKELKSREIEVSLKSIYDLMISHKQCDKTLGVISKLENIVESDFGRLLRGGENSKTFSQIRKEKACLYIGLSTQGYGETAMALGKIFLGELLFHSYSTLVNTKNSHNSMKNSISVFFDEFGSLVSPRFIELQNKCRGAGIELTMAVQTSSDIDRVDPTLTKQILENAANYFIFKQRLDEGASVFSNAIGTILTDKKTFVTEDGDKQSKGSVREVNELIVHPDIIKNLKVGQCVLLRHNPTRVDLINIRNRRLNIVVEDKDEKPAVVETTTKVEDSGHSRIDTGINLPNSFEVGSQNNQPI
ncbi:MAG: type IV secretory system conjugative DNA transfer family protein [Bacteriovoracaceae bacterium]